MHNEIKTIVKSMLAESMDNDALKSFAKQLKIVLKENSSGRTNTENSIKGHLESALEKHYQITLMNKKTFLTKSNYSNITKWTNALNGILKKLEEVNTNKDIKKKRYWSVSDIEKWITDYMRQDSYDFANKKVKRSLDFEADPTPPKATLKKMYNIVGRKMPNWVK